VKDRNNYAVLNTTSIKSVTLLLLDWPRGGF